MRIREATTADIPGIAKVHVASWQTTYRGMMPESYLAGLSVEESERNWTRYIGAPAPATVICVAEDEGAQVPVVGFAAGGPRRDGDPRYAGELYAIYLLKVAQGQGVGQQLVRAVAERLARAGISSMLVWVLEANPSRRFYEALGGVLLSERQSFVVAGMPLAEVSYGWPRIADLCAE